jgi:uncharacterized protein (DUF433 family)
VKQLKPTQTPGTVMFRAFVFSRWYANLLNMRDEEWLTIDPDILGGTPVFRGTRVPVKSLFDYLEDNYTLEEFTEFFPTVTLDMARRVLEQSESPTLHQHACATRGRGGPDQ